MAVIKCGDEDCKYIYLECTCTDMDHLLRIGYLKVDLEDDQAIYDDFFFSELEFDWLRIGETFWQRVRSSIKFIFNGNLKWTGFNSTCISIEDIEPVRKFIQEYEEYAKKGLKRLKELINEREKDEIKLHGKVKKQFAYRDEFLEIKKVCETIFKDN